MVGGQLVVTVKFSSDELGVFQLCIVTVKCWIGVIY